MFVFVLRNLLRLSQRSKKQMFEWLSSFCGSIVRTLTSTRDRRVFQTLESAIYIDDDLYETDPYYLGQADTEKTESWLFHVARTNEWEAQVGDYAPIGASGIKETTVPLFDSDRLQNYVRGSVFTKSMAIQERQKTYENSSIDNDDHLEVEIDVSDHKLIAIPIQNEDIEWVGELNYPQLKRPLRRSEDKFVAFDLVFDVETVEVLVPESWEINDAIEAQETERKRIERQEQF